MKRSDLFREYARVIDMCEGTKIDPMMCVKIRGYFIDFGCDMVFDGNVSDYTFAIGICEGKPVFAGDVLYDIETSCKFTMGCVHVAYDPTDFSCVTWKKPDPYAELKKAHAGGKVIQGLTFDGGWVDVQVQQAWSSAPETYRIKPEPVVVTEKQFVGGLKNAPVREVMCTWTDAVLAGIHKIEAQLPYMDVMMLYRAMQEMKALSLAERTPRLEDIQAVNILNEKTGETRRIERGAA